MMNWIYFNNKHVGFCVDRYKLKGCEPFKNDWIEIAPEFETIFINKGYAWDGCSPKFGSFMGLFWIGTPDGIMLKDGFTITGKASMLHDALYQFLGQHNLTRKQCDKIFAEQLQRDGFKLWPVYYAAVRVFGGVSNWVYNKIKRNKKGA